VPPSRLRIWLRAGGGGLLAAAAVQAAQAEDLREALVSAYNTNPTLQGARASQRATDEDVAIEKADGRPSLSGDVAYTEFLKQSSSSFIAPKRLLQADLSLGVPIYSGGAVRNGVKAAKTRVEAGQADLRGTESSLFSEVVGAYMDVILDEAVVGLNRNNVQVLEVNFQATSDRFEIGDLTRTDVAQSQSRLALARGDTRTAEANLAAARERYIQLVGHPPGSLDPPPPLPGLPASPEDAVQVALDGNPDLIAARERRKAAGYDVRVAAASRLPRLQIVGSGSRQDYLGSISTGSIPGLSVAQVSNSAQIGAQISIPLYQGGRPAALRRQAQAREGAAMEQEIAAERDVIAQVRAAYSSWQASNEIITSNQSAVDAAALSLEGVRAENSVGNRTVLDILNAEQELVQARVRLVTARRNAYVAGFTLLAAMGKAEAQDLGLDGGALYNPDINYKRVRGKWFDWDDDPAPKPQSTRTVDTPVQDGEIHGTESTTIQATDTKAPGGQ
jgi:outer membrane protein